MIERVVPYERDERDLDRPPVDGLAECVCLHACVYDPALIDQFDLGRLVVHPEHRELWRVLRLTRARTRALEPAAFLAEFYRDLAAAHPDNWENYDDLLTSVGDRESARAWQEYQDGFGDLPFTSFLHDFCWWLRRLQRAADARRMLHAAQEMAERAWVEDIDGSRGIARRVVGHEMIRVDV